MKNGDGLTAPLRERAEPVILKVYVGCKICLVLKLFDLFYELFPMINLFIVILYLNSHPSFPSTCNLGLKVELAENQREGKYTSPVFVWHPAVSAEVGSINRKPYGSLER
jgi:hypothetical protein